MTELANRRRREEPTQGTEWIILNVQVQFIHVQMFQGLIDFGNRLSVLEFGQELAAPRIFDPLLAFLAGFRINEFIGVQFHPSFQVGLPGDGIGRTLYR